MAIFPELIPSTRTYSPGAFPHTAHGVYDGSEVRVRHSNTVLGVRLRLFFPALSTADLLTVISHYNGQRGRFLPFAIPDELLSGTDTPADFTPAGYQWRYLTRPAVEDISVHGPSPTNLHNVTVELETVPPENTIVQGARLRARSSLRAGSAQRGIFLDVETSLAAGSAAAQLDFTVPITFQPGSPFPVVGFDVTATLTAGEFIPPPDSLFVVTASLAAGGASGEFDILSLSPAAWWDASDSATVTTSSGDVTDVQDKSGNGWDLEQTSSGNRPAYSTAALNGLNAIEWSASANPDYLQSASGSFTVQEFYAVIEYGDLDAFGNFPGLFNPADSTVNPWFSGGNGSEGIQAGHPVYINDDNSTDYQSDMFPEIEVPCVIRWTRSSATTTTTGVVLGMDRLLFGLNRGWRGLVGELVAFDSPLGTSDRADLVTHLMDKWGI